MKSSPVARRVPSSLFILASCALAACATGPQIPPVTGQESLEQLAKNKDDWETRCQIDRDPAACAWVSAFWKADYEDKQRRCETGPVGTDRERNETGNACGDAAGYALGCGTVRGYDDWVGPIEHGQLRDDEAFRRDNLIPSHCTVSLDPRDLVTAPEVDVAKALDFLALGCHRGLTSSCSAVVAVLLQGVIAGIPVARDAKMAKKLWRKSFEADERKRGGPNWKEENFGTGAVAEREIEKMWQIQSNGYAQLSDAELDARVEHVVEVYDESLKRHALFEAEMAGSVERRKSYNTMDAIAAGLAGGMATTSATNQSLAQMHQSVDASVAASRASGKGGQAAQAARLNAALNGQPQPGAPAQKDTAAAAAKQEASAKGAGDRQGKLSACLAKPVSVAHVTQTNPFAAHAQTFGQLLRSAGDGGCGRADSESAWRACMGTHAMGALWQDEDRAQRDHDELFRRFNASADKFQGGSSGACLDQPVRGTRDQCVNDSASVEVVRSNCAAKLKQDEAQMECDAKMLPLVWDAEEAQAKADAEERRDAACRVRFGDP